MSHIISHIHIKRQQKVKQEKHNKTHSKINSQTCITEVIKTTMIPHKIKKPLFSKCKKKFCP